MTATINNRKVNVQKGVNPYIVRALDSNKIRDREGKLVQEAHEEHRRLHLENWKHGLLEYAQWSLSDVACLCDLSYTTLLKDAESKKLQAGMKGSRNRANNHAAVRQWLVNRKNCGKKWTEAAEILLAYLG